MKPPRDGIRKAALLVAALDPQTADLVLRRMAPEQAESVRSAAAELIEIDAAEQRRIIDEFFRIGPMVPGKEPAGIDLDGRRAGKHGPRAHLAVPDAPAALAGEGPPFGFLREAEAERLARVLAAERPQTVALVLSHMTAAQAGGVLARLAPPLQVEVVRRLVDLEETSPEILREVERGLQSKLSGQVFAERRRVAGPAAVAGILEAAGPTLGGEILDNLAAHDRALADRLGPARIEFHELADLDHVSLRAVFSTADFELVALALTGEAPELVDRVLGLLPAAAAQSLRARLDNPRPMRLRDTEEARRRIAAHAQRLVAEGRIPRPRGRPRLMDHTIA